MIGVIPAAGNANRFRNKPKSLQIYKGKELIKYPLQIMEDIGIRDVVIIQNENVISDILGNNYRKIKLFYVNQLEKKGIAHAISLTENITLDQDICVILGDIYYEGSILEMKNLFLKNNHDAIITCRKTDDLDKMKKSFGFDNSGKFFEKPSDVSLLLPYEGCGIYMFKPLIYDLVKKLAINEISGEYEITDLLNLFNSIGKFELFDKYKNINFPEDLTD